MFSDDHTAVVALAIHDSVYLVDFSVKHLELDDQGDEDGDRIADYVIEAIESYEHENFSKFIGAGLPTTLKYMSPTLCSRLWLELDIIPIVMRPDEEHKEASFWDVKRVDEQADSMARKCILHFGPSLVPLLQVGWRGIVQTDAGFRAHLTNVQNHKDTCGSSTWSSVAYHTKQLRTNKVKIAFFSSTPQGGGVALMRHALVRFSRLMGVDLTWYGRSTQSYYILYPRKHTYLVDCRLIHQQSPSHAQVSLESPKTSTTFFRASVTPTSAYLQRKRPLLSAGSQTMQTDTGFPRAVPCALLKKAVPMSSSYVLCRAVLHYCVSEATDTRRLD